MNREVWRLMDANFNRAREALRVMEDYARFVLNDGVLSGLAKELRHDFCQALSWLPETDIAGARDIIGDVGTTITTASERQRRDAGAVARASAKRLSEALRCLEEYGKIESTQFAGEIETIRYRAYDLELRVEFRVQVADRFESVGLYVLLTESLCRLPILETARAVLEGGADAVQLREKDKSDGELLALARDLRQLCHQHCALFLMNDRADLVMLSGADGVHLGQHDLAVSEARKLMGPGKVVGKSSHSLDEAQRALAEGADYIAVGSVFGSRTKPQVTRSGLELIGQVRLVCDRPLIAIGGVDGGNAQEAIHAGADGIAVCQAIVGAEDPCEQAEQIKAKVYCLLNKNA